MQSIMIMSIAKKTTHLMVARRQKEKGGDGGRDQGQNVSSKAISPSDLHSCSSSA